MSPRPRSGPWTAAAPLRTSMHRLRPVRPRTGGTTPRTPDPVLFGSAGRARVWRGCAAWVCTGQRPCLPARRRSGPGVPRAVVSLRDPERPCRAPSGGPRRTGAVPAAGDRSFPSAPRRSPPRRRSRACSIRVPRALVPSCPWHPRPCGRGSPGRPFPLMPRSWPSPASPSGAPPARRGCGSAAGRGRRHGVPSGTGRAGRPTRRRLAPPPRSPRRPATPDGKYTDPDAGVYSDPDPVGDRPERIRRVRR